MVFWDFVIQYNYEIFLLFVISASSFISYLQRNSWNSNSSSLRAYSSELCLTFAAILILMCILFINGELAYHLQEEHSQPFYYNNADFDSTPFLFFSKLFAIFLTCCSLLLSYNTIKFSTFTRIEYPFFFLTALLAILFLISSYHLLYIYLSLELLNFSLYIIIGGKVFSSLANEASQRYFVYSSYASALFLLGIALLYGLFGSLNLHELGLLASQSLAPFNQKMLLGVALLFIYAGLLFKLSIFPFHFWVSEIYEGSPLPSILFLTTAPKIALLTLYLKLTLLLASQLSFFLCLLQFLCILSIAYGTIAGLYEYRLKRFLAYSTIGNMGFIFLSLSFLNIPSIIAGLLYFFIYLLTITAFLGLLMLFQLETNLTKEKSNLESLELKDIFSLKYYQNYPAYLFAFTILILSLAGIPPLAGFFIKLYLLKACLLIGNPLMAFLIFLLSILALGFYLRLLRIFYVTPLALSFNKKSLKSIILSIRGLPPSTFLLLIAILFFTITYGLFFNNTLLFYFILLVLTSF